MVRSCLPWIHQQAQAQKPSGLLSLLDPIGDPVPSNPDDSKLVTDQRGQPLIARHAPSAEEISQWHASSTHPERHESIARHRSPNTHAPESRLKSTSSSQEVFRSGSISTSIPQPAHGTTVRPGKINAIGSSTKAATGAEVPETDIRRSTNASRSIETSTQAPIATRGTSSFRIRAASRFHRRADMLASGQPARCQTRRRASVRRNRGADRKSRCLRTTRSGASVMSASCNSTRSSTSITR